MNIYPTLPTFGEQFAQKFAGGVEKGLEKHEEAKKLAGLNKFVKKEFGYDLSEVPKEFQEKVGLKLFEDKLNRESEKAKSQQKMDMLSGLFNKGHSSPSNNPQMNPQGRPEMSTSQNVEQEMAQEGFDPMQISDEDIAKASTIDPNLAKSLQHAKDVALRERTAKENQKLEEKQMFHKETSDYDKEIIDSNSRAKKQKIATADIRKRLKSGNVNPVSLSNFFKGKGEWGDKIANMFLNPDQAAIQASIPFLIEGWKDIFGIRLSDADLRVIQDKLPSIEKDASANEAILDVIDKYSDLSQQRFKYASEIKKANKGYRPSNYAEEIDSKMDQYIAEKYPSEEVTVFNPETGSTFSIPKEDLEAALEAGVELVNE